MVKDFKINLNYNDVTQTNERAQYTIGEIVYLSLHDLSLV